MRVPTHIMIHHSLTKDSGTVSWAAIEKYHKEVEEWQDIGYHAGVEWITDNPSLNKYAYQGLVGRGESEKASACPQGNMNSVALHVCCVGNFDILPPSQFILYRLVERFILDWMKRYSIPKENIVGHREFNPTKSCPGKLFDLTIVRRMVS